ncbi:hypothetical protein CSB09_00460 [Candidatus Gracilibacteria bacterium]|nr:MAG: hypothetical protein CSB09_00460 [Candidatus Gracilibacteria bacterium]
MNEKIFEGQYRDEKILLRTHPHIGVLFWQKIHLFFVYSVIIALNLLVVSFWWWQYIWICIAVNCILLGVYIWYLFFIKNRTRYTFTSRRCICFVRKGLLKTSYREIHLTELRQAIPKRQILGSVLGYGILILIDKEDQKIFYPGIKEHKHVARYLARIIDYIKIHGHTDNFSAYVPKKIRKHT